MRSHRLERIQSCAFRAWIAIALLASYARAQDTERVSVDSSGGQANDVSGYSTALSADGRYVAFPSQASNLVANDTNTAIDIFVHDRTLGVTERVNVDSAGVQANGDSAYRPAISADGRYVTFNSLATNLVSVDTNGASDIFLHDRVTGITERISVDSSGAQSDGGGWSSAISSDGRYVAFDDAGSNLVPNDTNGYPDIFVHDRVTGITERISVDSSGAQGKGPSHSPAISANGQYVAFSSISSSLVSNDTNGLNDIFVHDRVTGITERVSVDSSGAESDGDSLDAAISADGRHVAFDGNASNLVPNDTNSRWDVFVHDRTTGITQRVSVDSSGNEVYADCAGPAISGDGRLVAFTSRSGKLVPNDNNLVDDVFVHDRSTGITERDSVDSSGVEGKKASRAPSISADGEHVAFISDARNLVPRDTNQCTDVFVRNRCAALWSIYGSGFPGTIGVPSFTPRSDPVLGTTLTLDLANSYGSSTAGLLFLGYQRTQVRSGWGGDLLVVPVLTLPIALPPSGATFSGTIPNNPALCDFKIELQAVESDPGAAKSVSFTPGLELILGR